MREEAWGVSKQHKWRKWNCKQKGLKLPDVQEIDWIRNGEKSDINYLMEIIKNKKVNLHFFLEER